MDQSEPKKINYYLKADSKSPFIDWFESLIVKAQARVRSRIIRVANGNLGKTRSVGDGVHELKFKDKGFPTYRIYFSNDGESLVILLLGGDKSHQNDDIKLAKEYWNDYKQNK